MSFVKHLLLAPETPTIDDAARPNTNRLACSVKLRPLRRRLDAERLLRPQGSGLVSLTIPFEIDQDWSPISDLLLSPTIEYLAVDNFYCEILMASSTKSVEPITPADKFSKLKALTIYRSESSRDNKLLFHLIRSCNLHFFHFEERSRDQMTPIEIAELLISLQRQQNLKALVLIIPGSSCSAAIRMARRKQSKLWPNLKALYLGMGDEHWLEQIPDFKELQILSTQEFVPGPRIINSDVISKIGKCQELRVIDVYFRECNDIEALLDIAHGCPLLQMLRVLHRRLGGRLDPMNTKFSDLLRALPQLEFLELDLKFRINGAHIQDLAVHCPRLTVLRLHEAWLCLSIAQMRTVDPLRQLELVHFKDVHFENPQRLMEPHIFSTLVAEWRRIFPKLREMPCPADIYGIDMERGNMNDTSERNVVNIRSNDETSLSVLEDTEEYHSDMLTLSSDEEMFSDESEDSEEEASEEGEEEEEDEEVVFPGEPELNYNYFGSDWFFLRIKLWRELQYGQGQFTHDRIANIWRTNLEIEKIGWPVMPLEAYSDPESY
uniref:F-box/LRR-repeat protein 4 n=2 Tax=Talaromyces marneffei TaxID=37727 RepID=A0A093UQ52_TALMA